MVLFTRDWKWKNRLFLRGFAIYTLNKESDHFTLFGNQNTFTWNPMSGILPAYTFWKTATTSLFLTKETGGKLFGRVLFLYGKTGWVAADREE